jgi:hypothetical protein
MLATAGNASAASPITFTDASTFPDHFTGPDFPCQDELYDVTATGHALLHYDYFPDTDTFHVHFKPPRLRGRCSCRRHRPDLHGQLLGP